MEAASLEWSHPEERKTKKQYLANPADSFESWDLTTIALNPSFLNALWK